MACKHNQGQSKGSCTDNVSKVIDEERLFESYHSKTMALDLNSERLSDAKYCDVTLVSEGRKFPVHKSIVALQSEYFDTLFTTKMIEKNQDCLEVSGVGADDLGIILSFIYTGRVAMNKETVYSILACAHYLRMPRLLDHCFTFLSENKHLDNCIKSWLAARFYDVGDLKEECRKFIRRNMANLYRTSEFLHLNLEELRDLMRTKDEIVCHDKPAFNALCAWIRHDMENRKDSFSDLFHLLNLKRLEKGFLETEVARENLVQNKKELVGKVMEAIASMKITGKKPETFFAFNEDYTKLRLIDINHAQFPQIVACLEEPKHNASLFRVDNLLFLFGGSTTLAGKPKRTTLKLDLNHLDLGWEEMAPLHFARRKPDIYLETIRGNLNTICVDGGLGPHGSNLHDRNYFVYSSNFWITLRGLDNPDKFCWFHDLFSTALMKNNEEWKKVCEKGDTEETREKFLKQFLIDTVAAIGIEANRLWHRISGIDVSLESSYPRQIMCGIRTSSSCAARFASASLDELATSPLAKVIFDAASALGMDVEIASNTGPSEYFNKSARVDLLTLDYTLPGRFMIGVARSSDYLSDTTSDATSPSETGSSRFCNCLFRKIRLNTEKTSFIFSKAAPQGTKLQERKGTKDYPRLLLKWERVMNACIVKKKIVAVVHSQVEIPVCHYLGVYDIKNKSWTKLREIDSDGYEQYYKLFSVSA